MTRAVIGARVSTRDKGQTNNNLLELLLFTDWLGYTIYKAYCNQQSGGIAGRIEAGQARRASKSGCPAPDPAKVAGQHRLRGERFRFKKIQSATGVPVAVMLTSLTA